MNKTLFDYCHYIHLHFVIVLIMLISGVIISFRYKLQVKKFWLYKNDKKNGKHCLILNFIHKSINCMDNLAHNYQLLYSNCNFLAI